MSDLIDRQAAITAIEETIWDTSIANDVISTIKELPSAQPEMDCQKCIFFFGFPSFQQFSDGTAE